MTPAGRRPAPEAGLTLVELLVAVAILGIAFLSIVGGMGANIITTDIHRKQATAQVSLGAFAEAVKAAPYVDCAQPSDYQSSYTAPAGFTAAVTAVAYWEPPPASQTPPSFTGTCPAADTGLQRVGVSVTSSDGRATETLTVLKRKPPTP